MNFTPVFLGKQDVVITSGARGGRPAGEDLTA